MKIRKFRLIFKSNMLVFCILTLFMIPTGQVVSLEKKLEYESLNNVARSSNKPLKIIIIGEKSYEIREIIEKWNKKFVKTFPKKPLYDEIVVVKEKEKWPNYLSVGSIFIKDDYDEKKFLEERLFYKSYEIALGKYAVKEKMTNSEFIFEHGYKSTNPKELGCASFYTTLNKKTISIFMHLNVNDMLTGGASSVACSILFVSTIFSLNSTDGIRMKIKIKNFWDEEKDFLDAFFHEDRGWIVKEINEQL